MGKTFRPAAPICWKKGGIFHIQLPIHRKWSKFRLLTLCVHTNYHKPPINPRSPRDRPEIARDAPESKSRDTIAKLSSCTNHMQQVSSSFVKMAQNNQNHLKVVVFLSCAPKPSISCAISYARSPTLMVDDTQTEAVTHHQHLTAHLC